MNATDFIVARNDLQQCKLIETHLPDATALPEDALLIKIDSFAFYRQQYHLRGSRRSVEILAAVSGAAGFRQHSGVGIWRCDRLESSRRRRRRTAVRLF